MRSGVPDLPAASRGGRGAAAALPPPSSGAGDGGGAPVDSCSCGGAGARAALERDLSALRIEATAAHRAVRQRDAELLARDVEITRLRREVSLAVMQVCVSLGVLA